MKKLQQNWGMVVGIVAVVVVAGSLWWQGVAGGAALMQEPLPLQPVTRAERDAVVGLLDRVGLDRDALTALNVTVEQAESLLTEVRTWQDTNKATLASLKLAVDQQVGAVRKIEKAIKMGTAGAGGAAQRDLRHQELADAKATSASALAPLERNLGSILSTSQRATWTAIRKGHGRKMPIRMLDLSNDQRLAVSRAERTYRRQRAAASTKAERETAVATRDAAMAGILTADQKNVVSAFSTYYAASSGAVAGAFDSVLAVDEG